MTYQEDILKKYKSCKTLEIALERAKNETIYLSRFESYLRKDSSGCHIWKGSSRKHPTGRPFPQYGAGGGGADVRRFVWAMAGKEPLLRSECLFNACGDDLCVNVEHLKIVKVSTITRDAQARARRKLTWKQVEEIRKKYSGESTLRELGKEYGMPFQQIQKIVTHQIYAEE
jgi:hypothetical protein